ncbi:hypothetical protein GA0115259_1024015 [Streptomyces sp. MnatMP-M17]|nr:hypothetical protein GA0115259_1024015 [Streptomyces sp. MnatMP-M17]
MRQESRHLVSISTAERRFGAPGTAKITERPQHM